MVRPNERRYVYLGRMCKQSKIGIFCTIGGQLLHIIQYLIIIHMHIPEAARLSLSTQYPELSTLLEKLLVERFPYIMIERRAGVRIAIRDDARLR